MENIFEEIKAKVSMNDLVRSHGFKPNKSGFIHCPFHADKTASLKVYPDSFCCYGCGASGSVIDFDMNLYGLSPLDAAKRINDDMRLGLPVDGERDPQDAADLQRARELKEQFEPYVDAMKSDLCAIIYRANIIQANLPDDLDKVSDDDAKILRYREIAEHKLDLLNNGSIEDRIDIIKHREEVYAVC